MRLIILPVCVSLEAVRSFETSVYDYAMRYLDILEESKFHISCYLYIVYTHEIRAPRICIHVYKGVHVLHLL
jgi:hypothetical protein